MNVRVWLLCAATSIAVAGCAAARSALFTPFASRPAVSNSAKTTAWGRLVDDPSERPLDGVRVALYPWTPCVKISAKAVKCPPPLRTTYTGADGRFELSNVPNGHYLLAIGDDNPADLVRPTIHDQVWFKGGDQHLIAPTLPAEPYDAPFRMRVPKVERSGLYRLMTIDMHERLCTQAWDEERAKRHVSPAVNDEWLLENTRTMAAYSATITPKTGHVYGVTNLVGWGWTFAVGGNSCFEVISQAFRRPVKGIYKAVDDPRTMWFGGTWHLGALVNGKRSGVGFSEFPEEIRLYPKGQKFNFLPAWP